MPESSGSDVSNSCVAADLDQTVGQYLRGSFPFGGFRQRVLDSDLLDSVTLRDCASDPDRMEAFLLKCRGIPNAATSRSRGCARQSAVLSRPEPRLRINLGTTGEIVIGPPEAG